MTMFGDRRAIRRAAAAICGVMVAVYAAIGLGATSIEPSEEMSLLTFGLGAASIFVIGAVLLLVLDVRLLWAAGAAVQLGIAGMYVAVSADRTPAFEAWGVGLRVLQVPLFILLVLLAVRPVGDTDDAASSTSTVSPNVTP